MQSARSGGTNSVGERKEDMDSDARWHLDKRVPIAMLLALIAQTGTGFWWAATTSERINNLEKRAEFSAPQADRLTRVEVKLDVVQEALGEIKRLLQAKTR